MLFCKLLLFHILITTKAYDFFCVNALLQASAFPLYLDAKANGRLHVLMLFCKLLLFHRS